MVRPAGGLRIIGVGSPFGVDRLGWDAIDALQLSCKGLDPVLELVKLETPLELLGGALQAAEAVIIIDALGGEGSADIVRISREQLLAEPVLLSSHGFGVSEALALAEALQELPRNLLLYGLRDLNGQGIAPLVPGLRVMLEQDLAMLLG